MTPAPLRVGPATTVTGEGENVRPFIVARPGGGAYLAWARRDEERTRVLFARSEDGKQFAPSIVVSPEEMDLDLGAESGPQMAVAPDHTIHIVWAAGSWKNSSSHSHHGKAPARPGNLNIYLSSSRDGGRTFTEPRRVNDDPDGAEHRFPTVAVDTRGIVCVTWLDKRLQDETRPDFSRVFFARSTDGGRSFSPNMDATSGQDHGICHCCKMGIAVHRRWGTFIAFRNAVGDLRDIFLVRGRPGKVTFSVPMRIDDSRWLIPGCPMNGPSLAFDNHDRLHAVWLTGGNIPGEPAVGPATDEGHKVLYRVFDSRNESWSEPLFLSVGSHPRLAVGREGTAWVAWDKDGVQLTRIDPDGSKPTESVTLSARNVIANFPSLALSSDGQLLVAWQEIDGQGREQVRVAALKNGDEAITGPTAPP